MSGRRLRAALIAAGILGYALLEHASNRPGAPPLLGAVLAISPPAIALLVVAARSPWRALTLPALLTAAVLLWAPARPLLERRFSALYLAQQCALYLTLAVVFGSSLLPGREPLCTVCARLVHPQLPPSAHRYTRALTVAWTLFFVLVVGVSVTLYLFAPRMVWSMFVNFLVLPLIGLMFAVEYALRARHVPELPRVSPLAAVRAYLAQRQHPAR